MFKAVDYKEKETKLKVKNEANLAAKVRKEVAHKEKRVAKEAKIAINPVKEAQ